MDYVHNTHDRRDMNVGQAVEHQGLLGKDTREDDMLPGSVMDAGPSHLVLGKLSPFVVEPDQLPGQLLGHSTPVHKRSHESEYDATDDEAPSDQIFTPLIKRKKTQLSSNMTTAESKNHSEAVYFKETFMRIFQPSIDNNILPQVMFVIQNQNMTICFYTFPPSTPVCRPEPMIFATSPITPTAQSAHKAV